MQYERFTLFVSGLCKSAGTLVAVGAHELIMSDYGELGPLDVQMPKQDAVWEMQSGLTVMSTLNTLTELFRSVLKPSEEEVILAGCLGDRALMPEPPWSPDSGFKFLSTEVETKAKRTLKKVKK